MSECFPRRLDRRGDCGHTSSGNSQADGVFEYSQMTGRSDGSDRSLSAGRRRTVVMAWRAGKPGVAESRQNFGVANPASLAAFAGRSCRLSKLRKRRPRSQRRTFGPANGHGIGATPSGWERRRRGADQRSRTYFGVTRGHPAYPHYRGMVTGSTGTQRGRSRALHGRCAAAPERILRVTKSQKRPS